jgi:hypothetical protein
MPAWSPLVLGAGELGAVEPDEAVGLAAADGLAGGTTPAGEALGEPAGEALAELPVLAGALVAGAPALPFPPSSCRPK